MATLKASDMQILQQIIVLNNKQAMKLSKYGEALFRTILVRAIGRVPHDVQEEYRTTLPKDENPGNMPLTSFTTKKLELLLSFQTATHAKVDEVLGEMGLE
ncbi:hypothetical protein LTR70_006698 [Exophiala xenobiotica]|uniref:Uncharacterized protein n=1 Tax=Lithohypha guttulata TaxID=1690604 RepID=A0ABR0K6I7_9EURO|nr:hypothetical protein LTR24_006224 [Lithohypha guttulata]KAK5315614.1 hypothetical protein LTR70_006698 [Exophiala xenobiotica]